MDIIVLSSGDSDEEFEPSVQGNRQSTTTRDPRLRPGTAYAERSTRSCPTGRRQPGVSGRATPSSPRSSARTSSRRAASNCAPESSDSENESMPTPPRAGGVSPHYTDAAGHRIYPTHYEHYPSPAGSTESNREYNPCGRSEDYRDQPNPYPSDEEEERDEQSPYVEDASGSDNAETHSVSSREDDDDSREGAAHYVFTGEDRCGYHQGSWIYLMRTSWETIRIEAPYRPPEVPIVTFPPSPVHLCIMGPDETEAAEDLGFPTDCPVEVTYSQDEEMGPGPSTSLPRGPTTSRPPPSPAVRLQSFSSDHPPPSRRAKPWSGSRNPATTRRTPGSFSDGRSPRSL
ncbi:uncharacterized protein LOC123037911 [Drosophila rhopaloa]|uniref:Uncharacterized protein n=1 Tax=Drosophila rhopaloa TaxID=1041015 RepID=A0ABM5JD02_DRORH|nr:uncharacterized protein LOC123037911 [Drosophila rhopaloa]